MADNVTLNSMSGGEVIATDQDGTDHVQWMKLKFGADGTFTVVEATKGLPAELVKHTDEASFAVNGASALTVLAAAGADTYNTIYKITITTNCIICCKISYSWTASCSCYSCH